MKKSLNEIYFDVCDRLYLNRLNQNKNINSKKLVEQIEKDEILKTTIENVFNDPSKYDVYYNKNTLELCIDNMPEDVGMKKHLFNRIEINY
jgi:hypothetical protein